MRRIAKKRYVVVWCLVGVVAGAGMAGRRLLRRFGDVRMGDAIAKFGARELGGCEIIVP